MRRVHAIKEEHVVSKGSVTEKTESESSSPLNIQVPPEHAAVITKLIKESGHFFRKR